MREYPVAFRVSLAAIVAPAITVLVLGCTPSMMGGPVRINSVEQETSIIRAEFGAPDFNYYRSLPEPERTAYRNDFISARMYAIDVQYSKYEASLTQERQNIGMLATTTNIALTGTASLINPVGTKNILSAVASGLTGTRAAYEDEVLLSQTIQLMQSQMRANRSRVGANILTKMNLPASRFTLAMALGDLEDYYRAGTITSAMVDAGHTVGREAIIEQHRRDAVTVISHPASDRSADLLLDFLYPNGRAGARNEENAGYLAQLIGLPSTRGLAPYLRDPRFVSLRVQMMRCVAARQAGTPCAPKSLAGNI